MQITYELEAKDIKAFQNYALKKNQAIKKVNLFNLSFIAVLSYWQLLYLIFWTDFLSNPNWLQLTIYFGIGTTTFVFVLGFSKGISYLMKRYAINSITRQHKYGDGVLGEHLIRLKDDFLIETTDVNETQHSWKGVERIEENNDYVFIYTSATNAHIIPKRYFKSEADALEFLEETKRLKDSAKTKFSPSYLASAG